MVSTEKYSFKNLEPWKHAQDFAVLIAKAVDGLPNRRSADVVGRQLLRSATSIAANIAEGHGRYSFGAYRNHLSIAKGSAAESQGWLDLLVRLGHMPEESGTALERKCDGLIAGLTRRIVALERQERDARKPLAVREEGPTWEIERFDEEQVLRFQGSKVPEAAPEVKP
jgi:four helix bundle protein